jgi:5-methylcytosine-specific restriction endonuclease McrA
MCQERNQLTPATVVDHKVPHRGDDALFWDSDNWQGLCATHHSSTKQRQEATGRLQGCDATGQPLDQAHHWNAKR